MLTMASESLFGRCLALLTGQGADALLIVLQALMIFCALVCPWTNLIVS